MKIGELIESLVAAAEALPDGMEAEVRVHLCRGRDNFAIFTKEVTVDATEAAALIQGHPHLDDGDTVRRPLTMGVDDELRRLVNNPGAEPKALPNSVIVQVGESKGYRLPLRANGDILAPGELEALRVGCLCDPGRNELAREAASDAESVAMVVKDDCPVHKTVMLPPPSGQT